MSAKLWPFQQAEQALSRFGGEPCLLFETGYGPSGLPHIGTFCEVARSSWIRQAVEILRPGHLTELYAFSDDMDGLRKVPLNLTAEQREVLEQHLGRPLCDIPDPFGCCESYADHNNGELRKMLDRYSFRYVFKSSREQYRSGAFNEGLRAILRNVDAVRATILPTLSPEKREEWSPFLPLCSSCGRVNTTLVTAYHPDRDSIEYRCARESGDGEPCGHQEETSVLDGRVKAGWKVDWALRWFVFGVHYEMYGKDLIESAHLSRKIVRILGGKPPVDYFYEMFLDEQGSKISKSVGRGITVDRWLHYGPPESLALFLFRNPRKARRLSWEVIPRSVDEYLDLLRAAFDPETPTPEEIRFLEPELPSENPYLYGVSFSMILNLVATVGGDDVALIARYIHEYRGERPHSDPFLHMLIGHAVRFHQEVVLPESSPPRFEEAEKLLLADMATFLADPHNEDETQTRAFELARKHGLAPEAAFRALDRAISGQDHGPRFGPFVQLVGQETAREALARSSSAL